jgi:uncharacterized protein YdhG (YjbR/CyaY superfamily)
VDAYIASQPKAMRELLERVRSTIRAAIPGADEVISYKIPSYQLRGEPVLYFAGWKQHYSLYPASDQLLAAFKGELANCTVKSRTLRFPLSQPVPVRLLGRIAKFRAREVARRRKAKRA